MQRLLNRTPSYNSIRTSLAVIDDGTMPIDKFNTHLYARHQHSAAIETVSHFRYDTLCYVVGIYTDANGNYRLRHSDTTEQYYLFPLKHATIAAARYAPSTAQVYINDKEYNPSSLVGVTLKENDRISVVGTPNATTVYNPNAVFALELVITVRIRSDADRQI